MQSLLDRHNPLFWLAMLLAWLALSLHLLGPKVASGDFSVGGDSSSWSVPERTGISGLAGIGGEICVGCHDTFKYSHSGLGGPAAMIIAIAVAYFTAGALSGLVANGATAAGASTAATSAGGAWAAGTGTSLSGVGWANAAVTAGLTGMTSNAAVSTINNRGNLGAVIKDITSEDALRGYAVAGITAGLTNGLYDGLIGTETGAAGAIQNGGNVLANGGLSTLDGIGRFAGNQLLQNGTSTVLDRALGGDSSFSDALRSSLANTFAAAGFNWIGDVTAKEQWNLADGSPGKVAMHAVMGGLAAEAAGGDFKTGALAAGVNELLVDTLAKS